MKKPLAIWEQAIAVYCRDVVGNESKAEAVIQHLKNGLFEPGFALCDQSINDWWADYLQGLAGLEKNAIALQVGDTLSDRIACHFSPAHYLAMLAFLRWGERIQGIEYRLQDPAHGRMVGEADCVDLFTPSADRILYILRGVPGTGKTTRALELCKQLDLVVEADQFPHRYIRHQGVLMGLNPTVSNADAHAWANGVLKSLLAMHLPKVAIANTMCKREWVQPFIMLADRYGYQPVVVDCTTEYGSIHNVPDEVMNRMRETWEPWESVNAVLHV